MAKNIEMNWFNGSGYEALYPFTTIRQVQNLQSTISSMNSTISSNYNELSSIIATKGLRTQVISRKGSGGMETSVTITFSFPPTIVLANNIERYHSAGFWFNNYWFSIADFSGGDSGTTFVGTLSGNSISWSYKISGINTTRVYFNDSDSTWQFIGLA